MDRQQHYHWMARSADYAAEFHRLQQIVVDKLEDEMRRRALQGVFEPNVFQGRFVYPQEEVEIEPAVLDRKGRVIQPARTEWRDKEGARPLGIWRKSDRLLMFWLRAWKPERYRTNAALELTGPDGGPIEIVERLNAGRARIAALKDAPK